MSARGIENRVDFRVLAESEEWIVVDKPAPLLVHPTRPGGPRTLWDELRDLLAYEIANGGQVSIINRLDRETSGVVLIAKTRAAAGHFGRMMARRRVRKEYEVLVHGWPGEDRFEVDAPLLRLGEVAPSEIWVKQGVHPDGAPSRTAFSVRARITAPTPLGDRFSRLRARPVTGRMHQIRVHLAHAGLPVVGDKLYGRDERCYLDFIDHGWTPSLERRLLLPRQALHSALLAVPDESGVERVWESACPGDWRSTLGAVSAGEGP